MSTIRIDHPYTIPRDQLTEKLKGLAQDLSQRYQLQCAWVDDDCLTFKRNGANGEVKVAEGVLKLSLKLGMMLGMFSDTIEKDINKYLNTHIC